VSRFSRNSWLNEYSSGVEQPPPKMITPAPMHASHARALIVFKFFMLSPMRAKHMPVAVRGIPAHVRLKSLEYLQNAQRSVPDLQTATPGCDQQSIQTNNSVPPCNLSSARRIASICPALCSCSSNG